MKSSGKVYFWWDGCSLLGTGATIIKILRCVIKDKIVSKAI